MANPARKLNAQLQNEVMFAELGTSVSEGINEEYGWIKKLAPLRCQVIVEAFSGAWEGYSSYNKDNHKNDRQRHCIEQDLSHSIKTAFYDPPDDRPAYDQSYQEGPLNSDKIPGVALCRGHTENNLLKMLAG